MYKEKILNFLITIVLICTSGVVQFTFIWNSQSIVFLFLFSTSLFWLLRKWKMPKNKVIKLLLLCEIIVINSVIYNSNLDGHISLLLVTLSGCFLSQIIEWKWFAHYYVNIMVIVCIISLACFAFLTINPMVIMSSIPVVKYWSMESRYAFIYNFPSNQYVMRNFGPYHEGGMFAIFIIAAILILLGQEKTTQREKGYIIIYIVTIVTTFSTTGILLLFIILAEKAGEQISTFKISLKTVLMVAIGIGFIVLEESTYGIVINKFAADNSSFLARNLEWKILFEQIWNRPFWGVGYQNNQLITQYGLIDGTNGLVSILLQFGLVGGIVILMSYWNGLASFSSTRRKKILYLIIAFFSFAAEPTIFQPLSLCFLFGKSKLSSQKAKQCIKKHDIFNED